MKEIGYGFGKTVKGKSFEKVKNEVVDALKAEGFGVLTEIDVRATLKKKLDLDFRPYTILGACNPPFAHKSLEAEPHIGLLLPCNVVVQQSGTDLVEVSVLSPKAVFGLVKQPEIAPIAEEVENKLRRALDAVR